MKKTEYANIKRTPVEIDADKLIHAPWNPRPKITAENVKELSGSIREKGLIHRLDVWSDAKGTYVVIAGNRRLVACRIIGMQKIPCDVMDIDEEHAREITITENLQREDVNPFMQADNIETLRKKGRSIEEIASAIGKGVNWVWKRVQLTKINKEYMKIYDDTPLTLDALEKIGRYSAETQKAALGEVKDKIRYRSEGLKDEEVSWNEIKQAFKSLENDLVNAKFNTEECETCANNTATQQDLFAFGGDGLFVKKGGKTCGTCMNKKCYAKKYAAWVEEHKKKLAKKHGCEVKHYDNSWNVPGGTSETKSKTYCVPVTYTDYHGTEVFAWAQPKTSSGPSGKSEKQKAEEKAERQRKKTTKAACAKITAWCDEHLEQAVATLIGRHDPKGEILIKHIAERIDTHLGGYDAAKECAIVYMTLMPLEASMHNEEYVLTEDEKKVIEETWDEHVRNTMPEAESKTETSEGEKKQEA